MAEFSDQRPRRDLSDLYAELSALGYQIGDQPTPAPSRRRRPRRRRLVTAVLLLCGLGLIGGGVYVIAVPLIGVWQRGSADAKALQDWTHGGSQALVGGVGDTHEVLPTSCNPASIPADDYALVSFPSLARYGYSGVAGNGTWDELKSRSMVHYQGTPDPGQPGNVIFAFHREPGYEHIDQLSSGDLIAVQDRSCKVFHYKVTQRWILDPDAVTQLNPTTGHDLTLVTCTPFWVDSQRIVWRATLTS